MKKITGTSNIAYKKIDNLQTELLFIFYEMIPVIINPTTIPNGEKA